MYDINLAEYCIGGAYEDKGCHDAKTYLGKDAQCRNCPFKECINNLPRLTKRILFNASLIKEAFVFFDALKSYRMVSDILNINYRNVVHWIKNRSIIEAKLEQYLNG